MIFGSYKMSSVKTMANYPPSAAEAADKAAAKFGRVTYRRGRPVKEFDWSTVTPEIRAAAIADYYEKKKL